MADTGRDIVEYLQEFHKEERTAIKGRELCVLFNLTEKQLRNVVRQKFLLFLMLRQQVMWSPVFLQITRLTEILITMCIPIIL